ncbi:MAG: citrate synthase, partial [Lachnospiraceae bacterium]|nr:citrate synthase [Candidatus Equihabitans merdae]
QDIMNSMTRSILTLASYDPAGTQTDLDITIRQSLELIACFPMLAVYAYHAYNHYENYNSMYIHMPSKTCSTAENILRMLRPNKKYTPTEAKVLDACLMIHMEHGGGNNSTFTTRVVTSSGSDTYSSIAAGMSSLKGPRHGGANIKVIEMFDDIHAHVKDPYDEEAISAYLGKILDKEAFDKKGLIYGMGHAIYTVSDPRERVLKDFVLKLAAEKKMEKELALYENVEKLAPKLIAEKRHIYKGVNPNVDFYSGLVYKMLGIPKELFTPLFAIARISGWCAHRIEELVSNGKIIRPAYMSVINVNNTNDPNMPDNVV